MKNSLTKTVTWCVLSPLFCSAATFALEIDNVLEIVDKDQSRTGVELQESNTPWTIYNNAYNGSELSITSFIGGQFTIPFVIDSGAPTGSLYLSRAGKLGVNTDTPGGPLGSNLSVSNSGGGTSPSSIHFNNGVENWSFGSSLGLGAIIAKGTTAYLNIDSSGDVGMSPGGSGPEARLHVGGTTDAKVLVKNTNASDTSDKFMFELKNASKAKVRFSIVSNGDNAWSFDNNPRNNQFSISKVGTFVNEFALTSAGNGTFRGNVTATGFNNVSTREAKTGFAAIDTQDMLARVAALPLSEWRYKAEDASARHVGPMAEDFQQMFDLGDGKTISTVDASGIALAAIQGLKQEKDQQLAEKDAEIAALKGELQALRTAQEQRMMELELALGEVLRNQAKEVQVGSSR
jgi:hypothetical protein